MNRSTQKYYSNLKKSPLTPPSFVFGIVWPILYLLLIYYFILLTNNKKCSGMCLTSIVFIIQMVFNLAWSPVFFRLQRVRWAWIINIIMIILTLVTMYLNTKINSRLNYILIPYLVWISFAAYLNGYIVVKNPQLKW